MPLSLLTVFKNFHPSCLVSHPIKFHFLLLYMHIFMCLYLCNCLSIVEVQSVPLIVISNALVELLMVVRQAGFLWTLQLYFAPCFWKHLFVILLRSIAFRFSPSECANQPGNWPVVISIFVIFLQLALNCDVLVRVQHTFSSGCLCTCLVLWGCVLLWGDFFSGLPTTRNLLLLTCFFMTKVITSGISFISRRKCYRNRSGFSVHLFLGLHVLLWLALIPNYLSLLSILLKDYF